MTTSLPSSSVENGMIISSTVVADRRAAVAVPGEARLDDHLAGQLHVADAVRRELLAARRTAAAARKFCVVHAHTVPVVLSSNGTIASDAHRGQP